MTTKHYFTLFFSVVMLCFCNFAEATTFTTTANNSWSPYTPGNNTTSSDEFIISHNVKLYGLTLANGGKITIKDGGYLSMKWSGNFASGSEVVIEDGGTLRIKWLTVTNSGDVDIYGRLIVNGSTFTNQSAGSITYHPGGDWDLINATFSNSGNVTLNEDANWSSGTFSSTQGTVTLNGILSVINFNIGNTASVVGIGQIDLNSSGSFNNSGGTINGCSGNSCIPPNKVGQTIYLAGVLTGGGGVPQQYNGGTLPSGTCTASLQVTDDLTLSSDYEIGMLFVSPGVTVTVDTTATLKVCSKIVNEGDVIVKNAASILQTDSLDANSGSGNYHIYRNASDNPYEYHSLASPVESAYIPDVFVEENPCDLFCFDAETQSWLYDYVDGYQTSCSGASVNFDTSFLITGSDGIMDLARGYFVTGDADGNKLFEGQINNGPIDVNVYETGMGHQPNWNDDDWNLIGNPYPSALDLDAFYQENQAVLSGNFYFWVDDNSNGATYDQSNDYAVYNSFSAISANGCDLPTQYIGSVQGFWAVAQIDGVVSFNNSMRVNGNNTKYYKNHGQQNSVVWIDLTNEHHHFNQMSLGFSDVSTDSADKAMDAPKIEEPTGVALASRMAGRNYSIQAIARPQDFESKWVDLFVSTKVSAKHTIKASKFQNIPNNINVWLFDSVTQAMVNLKQDSYSLELDSNVYTSRFKVMFEQTGPEVTSVNEVGDKSNISVYTNASGIQVLENGTSKIKEVQVYNTLGQIIAQKRVNALSVTITMDAFTSGAYIVYVTSENGDRKQQKIMWSR